jgi:signal transduction histidine kinase
MEVDRAVERYRELQSYVGWTKDDERRVAAAARYVDPYLPALIDDFYAEIERHPEALRVVTGGPEQIHRLKGTLVQWIHELFAGRYDADYVSRRWRVGWRHVEIGLDQVYTNVALSRLRTGLSRALHESWDAEPAELKATIRSLDTLLDLDLALIEDAYQVEYMSRLQRTERFATLGQVAGGVAHELRNPLNVIKTSVYYLLHARNSTQDKRAEHLQRIERHVELADNVISALSSFAKMPVPSLCPCELGPLIRETLEVNEPRAEIEVRVDIAPGTHPALGDAAQLKIALGNLIRNACDAMPGGGTLSISAADADDGVEISVRDSGTGIAPHDLAQIMEPLYSTKARGLGLGLSIARSILEKNQGGVRVSSELGVGSTFVVRLTPAPLDGEPS